MSEEVHPRADELDSLTTLELLEVMHAEDRNALEAIRPHLNEVGRAVEEIAARIRSGGRLHYFGAGTSGRIAMLDAAECSPTFGVSADLVQAHQGGDDEHEDDLTLGQHHAMQSGLVPVDAVVGITASGTTPYALSALDQAKRAGALVVAITSTPGSRASQLADISIDIETGPEVIAGSTRLKSGTVQKVVLNMISTAVFTQLGHTYRGRMVDVIVTNDKRRARGARVVADLSGVSRDEAERALTEAGGSTKVAVLMLRSHLPAQDARDRLAAAGGDLNAVLSQVRQT